MDTDLNRNTKNGNRFIFLVVTFLVFFPSFSTVCVMGNFFYGAIAAIIYALIVVVNFFGGDLIELAKRFFGLRLPLWCLGLVIGSLFLCAGFFWTRGVPFVLH